jgi:hypothetical protein
MNRAVAAATESDIVILSTHAEQNRPLELEEWFVRWANARKNQPCAVVLLIDGIGRGCNGDSMLRRLENVAGISSVEIFYRVCDDEPGVVERNTQEREGEFVKPGGSLDATARRLAMEPLFRN